MNGPSGSEECSPCVEPAGPGAGGAPVSPTARAFAALTDRRVRRDIKTLARFISVYCDGLHGQERREPFRLPHVDVDALTGRPFSLCAQCRRLMGHALMKRALCPFDPKPACKRCVRHCYAAQYRDQIRRVMQYSGKRLLLTGRLDYLLHLLF